MSRGNNSSLFGRPLAKREKRLTSPQASKATAKISETWNEYLPDKNLDITRLPEQRKAAIATVIEAAQTTIGLDLSAHFLETLLNETWHAYLPPYISSALTPHIFKLISFACQSEGSEDEHNSFYPHLCVLISIALRQLPNQNAAINTLKQLDTFLTALYTAGLSLQKAAGFLVEATDRAMDSFSRCITYINELRLPHARGLLLALFKLTHQMNRDRLLTYFCNITTQTALAQGLLTTLARIDDEQLLIRLVNITEHITDEIPGVTDAFFLPKLYVISQAVAYNDPDNEGNFENFLYNYLEPIYSIMGAPIDVALIEKHNKNYIMTQISTKPEDLASVRSTLEASFSQIDNDEDNLNMIYSRLITTTLSGGDPIQEENARAQPGLRH